MSIEVVGEVDGLKSLIVTLKPEKWLTVKVDCTVNTVRYHDDDIDTVENFTVKNIDVFIDRVEAAVDAEGEIDAFLCNNRDGKLPAVQTKIEVKEIV